MKSVHEVIEMPFTFKDKKLHTQKKKTTTTMVITYKYYPFDG